MTAVATAAVPHPFPIPDGVFAETVVSVRHYTDRLFSFRITRPASQRFRSGEFVMIGLPNAERPVYRAYSIASPSWDEELEFFSIKVENGPLTEHLQKIRPGDTILMRKKPTGTLVLDALLPGKRLWLFSTGTGVASLRLGRARSREPTRSSRRSSSCRPAGRWRNSPTRPSSSRASRRIR